MVTLTRWARFCRSLRTSHTTVWESLAERGRAYMRRMLREAAVNDTILRLAAGRTQTAETLPGA